MPWKNESPMEEKQRFVSLVATDRFTMGELCESFGISRKTGHKWKRRYEAHGMAGLEERSRAPKTVTGRTEAVVERLIVGEKRLHPTWGPKKIHRVLEVKHALERAPAVSTVGEVLKRHGLVQARKRRGGLFTVERATLTKAQRCNHVLGVDFKGWFTLGDGGALRSADRERSFQSLSDEGRGHAGHDRTLDAAGVPQCFSALRVAGDNPGGQRRALRLDGAGGLEPAKRVVDRAGHRGAVQPAWMSPGQRLPRANAPDDEGGMLPARERQPLGAAAALRALAQGVQPGATA